MIFIYWNIKFTCSRSVWPSIVVINDWVCVAGFFTPTPTDPVKAKKKTLDGYSQKSRPINICAGLTLHYAPVRSDTAPPFLVAELFPTAGCAGKRMIFPPDTCIVGPKNAFRWQFVFVSNHFQITSLNYSLLSLECLLICTVLLPECLNSKACLHVPSTSLFCERHLWFFWHYV